MPRQSKAPASPDEPDRTEGAPAEIEGPVPPGVEPADGVTEKTAAELRAEAQARGVMPEEGSGASGGVVRADLERALEDAPPVGRPPLAQVAEQAAASIVRPTSEEE